MNKDEICQRCDGVGLIEVYHDAGDHFGAGSSPYSEWVTVKCPRCNGKGYVEEVEP